jgi:hypothetical protein
MSTPDPLKYYNASLYPFFGFGVSVFKVPRSFALRVVVSRSNGKDAWPFPPAFVVGVWGFQ